MACATNRCSLAPTEACTTAGVTPAARASGLSPGGATRLASLTECDGGGNCLAPTTFAWTSAQPGWGASLSVSLTAEQHAAAIPGDMNGDGWYDGACNERRTLVLTRVQGRAAGGAWLR